MFKQHTAFRKKKSECIKLHYFPLAKNPLSFEIVVQGSQVVNSPSSVVCSASWLEHVLADVIQAELQPSSI